MMYIKLPDNGEITKHLQPDQNTIKDAETDLFLIDKTSVKQPQENILSPFVVLRITCG